jgi:sugar lactone lactonase YvrE
MADVFAVGIQMGESPRWHDGRFWMCDWVAGEVLVFDADGNREVAARVEGLPFSIDWLPDGRLVARWADLGPGSAPDGICADAEGAIWYASVPGQRCSRVAVGGDVLDTVDADRGCFACMLGGDDGRTLYIVANRYADGSVSDGIVLTHRVAVPHAGRP